ncbi:MAG TPA: cation:proton antiporter [Anaerolineales bacterium]|nr:cation:proton antiporter [Anaerolineales bacterium]
MEAHIDFVPLLLVLFLSFLVPLLMGRVRWLPVVVGEIFAGVLIGASGFGLVVESEILTVFSDIGLAFLMFLAGLEIDFDRLFGKRNRGNGPNLLLLSFLVYLLTLALALPGGFILNSLGLGGNPWLFAFILSATSLGVLLPVLKQREMTNTPAGQAIFYTAMLADFVTVVLLTLFIIVLNQGLDMEVFSIGLLFLAFFLVYRLAGGFFRIPGVSRILDEMSQVTVQIKVRGAIAILMGFVVLAISLGLELILGAFLAGMIISLLKTPEDSDLVHKLEAFGFGFFVPVFFIMVGVNLDLRSIFQSPQELLLIPVILGISLVVKIVPALLFRRILSWRETFAVGTLLNTHLSLEIAVAVIGLQLGLITEAANVQIILFAVVTVLLMPILFNAVIPQQPEKKQRYMVIYAANDISLQVAKILRDHGEKVRFLDPETRQVDQARRAGFETIHATTITECLKEATKGEVQSLLVLSDEDTQNLLVSHAALQQNIDNIVAMVNDPSRLPEFRSLGVRTFTSIIYTPALLALLARSPDIFKILTTTTDRQDVREVYLRNPLSQGQRLAKLSLPGNLLVLSIGRNGDLIIPHGDTRLEMGDRLTIFGEMEDLQNAAGWLENPRPL